MALLTTAATLLVSVAAAGPYKLPWAPGTSMELTQDCNDSEFADHVGSGKFAWDFANGTHFPISVARSGVVTHLKVSSRSGCATSACVDQANYVVIDHGDGTASVYLHIDPDSLDPAVRCGQPVAQGQHLASAGSTGWSTGPHLHFQVNPVRPNQERTCECGADGRACGESDALWTAFWSSQTYPSLPMSFDEWPATACQDRRVVLPLSQNARPAGGDRPLLARAVDAAAPPPQLAAALPAPSRAANGVGGRASGTTSQGRHPTRSPALVSGKSAGPKTETRRPSRTNRASAQPRR